MNFRLLLMVGVFASGVHALDDAAFDGLLASYRAKFEAVYAAQRTIDTAEHLVRFSDSETQVMFDALMSDKDAPGRITRMLQSTDFALQSLSVALLNRRPEWVTRFVAADLVIFVAADSHPGISRQLVPLVSVVQDDYYRNMIVAFGMRSRSPQTSMAFGQLRKVPIQNSPTDPTPTP